MKFIFFKLIFIYLIYFSVNSQLFEIIQSNEHSNDKNLDNASIPADQSLFDSINIKQNTHSPLTNIDSINKKSEETSDIINEKIEKNKKITSELEKKQIEKNKLQRIELEKLQNKFYEISKKTKYISKILYDEKSIGQIKSKLFKNTSGWKELFNKLNNLNQEISSQLINLSNIEKEIDAFSNNNHMEEMIAKTHINNADIDTKLTVGKNFITDKLLTNQLKMGNSKYTDNIIEFDNNFVISFAGKNYKLEDILNFNKKINKLRDNCGENLDCLITIEKDKIRQAKQDTIIKTIATIKTHIDNLRSS